jgi:hypothetical protein
MDNVANFEFVTRAFSVRKCKSCSTEHKRGDDLLYRWPRVVSSWNVMAHGDAREGKWRGNWRMEWVASILHTTSEHGVSSITTITTADAYTSAAHWTDAPANLNGLVRFAERRNLVSARVPSHIKHSLTSQKTRVCRDTAIRQTRLHRSHSLLGLQIYEGLKTSSLIISDLLPCSWNKKKYMLFAHNNNLTVGKTELPIVLLNLHRFFIPPWTKSFVLVTETFFRYFGLEDKDSKILRNVGNLAPTYTASDPRKLSSTSPQLWQVQILQTRWALIASKQRS